VAVREAVVLVAARQAAARERAKVEVARARAAKVRAAAVMGMGARVRVAAAMDVVQRVMGVMVAADWDLGEKAEEKVLRMVADQAGAADSAAQRSSRSSV